MERKAERLVAGFCGLADIDQMLGRRFVTDFQITVIDQVRQILVVTVHGCERTMTFQMFNALRQEGLIRDWTIEEVRK